jgi:hypothetical protein
VNFVYFNSKRVGINLDNVEWYAIRDSGEVAIHLASGMEFNLDNVEWYAIRDSGEVAIHLASGMEFFIQDSDEVDYFLRFSTDLEFDDEDTE